MSEYDATFGGNSARVTLSNLEPRDVGGQQVVPRKMQIGDASSSAIAFEFLATDAAGTYKVADQNPTDAEPRLLDPKEYFVQNPVRVGTQWRGTARAAKGAIAEPYTVVIEATDETVTVPLATFPHCLKTDRREHARDGMGNRVEIIRINWFARDVGLVKQITRQGDQVLESLQLVKQAR